MLLPVPLLNIQILQILIFKFCKLELKIYSINTCCAYDSYDISNYCFTLNIISCGKTAIFTLVTTGYDVQWRIIKNREVTIEN